MINEIITNFKSSNNDMLDISMYGEIPTELYGHDVYDYSYLFKNKDIVCNFLLSHLNCDLTLEELKERFDEDDQLDIHFETKCYCKYGNIVSKLNNGTYILWTAY